MLKAIPKTSCELIKDVEKSKNSTDFDCDQGISEVNQNFLRYWNEFWILDINHGRFIMR